MRKWAHLKPDTCFGGRTFQRVMVYEAEDGVWVYLYDAKDAVFCAEDLFYEDSESALEEWDGNIDDEGWHEIPDPLPDCQHDCILPIRVKGRDKGTPQWGQYEIYKDGVWEEFNNNNPT